MIINLLTVKCKQCGHQWTPRKIDVRLCPGCQSPKWDENNVDKVQPGNVNNDFSQPSDSLNLVDMEFGMLTVIAEAGSNRSGSTLWRCRCKCGKERTVLGRLLRQGIVSNCGCTKGKKRQSFWPKFEYAQTFNAYRSRAKQKGIAFELSKEQFLEMLLSACYYCRSTIEIGVDRKNSTVGYTPQNSVPACRICNYGKNKSTEEEFVAYINRIRDLGPVSRGQNKVSP